MSARGRILARLTRSQRDAAPPPPDVAAFYAARRRAAAPGELLAQFRANLEAVHGEVHDTDEAHWPDLLLRLAAAKGVRTLVTGIGADGARLAEMPELGLTLETYDRPVEDWRERLFEQMDAGLTRARAAIAATGSLVLWPGLGEPRLLSLVPPIHFVLLDANRMYPDLPGAISDDCWLAEGLPTNLLLVSGPSKTADIQQTLAYGAHGPRELVVLVCHGEGQP